MVRLPLDGTGLNCTRGLSLITGACAAVLSRRSLAASNVSGVEGGSNTSTWHCPLESRYVPDSMVPSWAPELTTPTLAVWDPAKHPLAVRQLSEESALSVFLCRLWGTGEVEWCRAAAPCCGARDCRCRGALTLESFLGPELLTDAGARRTEVLGPGLGSLKPLDEVRIP